MKRTNAQWLSDLQSPGPAQEAALADLRFLIAASLPLALTNWLAPDDPRLPDLVEEIAQETLLRVLRSLDTFKGRSQLTTWVHKISVHLAISELRHRRWKDFSLENMLNKDDLEATPAFMADPAPNPEQVAAQASVTAHVGRIMLEELTERQLQAMTAVVIQEIPMDVVARSLGMERNALYKMLFDARLRLKRRMERDGINLEEMLAVFEKKQ